MYTIIEKDIDVIINKIDFSQLKNKSILITGSSGLIGIYLISCLKRLQKELNIKIYSWNKSKIEDEFKYFFDFDCQIISEDITDISKFQELPYFDYIIHAAGYGQPGKFLENKIKTIQINTSSTIELIKKLNVDGKFLFISTSELYNGLDIYNITENEIGMTNTNHIRSSYIEGKRCGESICHSFINEGKNIKIARLSLGYGPGTKRDDKRVLHSLINKAIENETINLMDNGSAIRTYCYISDVIEMLWNILFFSKEHTYNIGGKSTISILDLAKMVGKEFNKDVVLPLIEHELSGSPKIVNISIDKYLKEFNKTDFISLEEGLKNTINWQKNYIKKLKNNNLLTPLSHEKENEIKISILMPTRGRFEFLKRSLDSIYNTSNTNNFEILLGMDNDDIETISKVKNYISDKINIRIIFFDRMYYKGFNKYVYKLAMESKGKLMWLMADDIEIVSNNWDSILLKYENEFVNVVVKCITAEGTVWEWGGWSLVPIIPKKWIQITSRVSDSSQTDLWIGIIAVHLGITKKEYDIVTNNFIQGDATQWDSLGNDFINKYNGEMTKDLQKLEYYLKNEYKKND